MSPRRVFRVFGSLVWQLYVTQVPMAFLAATMLRPARSGRLFDGQGGVGRMGAGPEVGV